LLIIGITETSRESCFDKIKPLLQKMGIDSNDRTFTRIHRLGKYTEGKTRPIIAKFHHFADREVVWRKRKQTDTGIRIIESFPQIIQRRRRILQEIANQAAKSPHYENKISMRLDKLIIDKKEYTVETLYRLPADLKTSAITRSVSEVKDGTLLFYGHSSPLSNFYPTSFAIDVVSFNCVEQFYYLKKAEYFKDRAAAVQILAATDPWSQKSLGKAIGESDLQWSSSNEAMAAMQIALKAKFTQNEYLKDILLSTGQSILAEASTHDKIWGTGIAIGKPGCHECGKWPGKNLLGGLLVSLRENL
jgi:ribA/ribD-fused uncharacterized protein